MIIEKVDQNRECFGEYTLVDGILTIAGIPVDLQAEQGEQEVIITFARCTGKVHRGMMPCGEYVADVIIPPRVYETVEVADAQSNDTAEGEAVDEEPRVHTESVPVTLDLESVTIRLWPIAVQNEQQSDGGM
jgi:hypothetical protein